MPGGWLAWALTSVCVLGALYWCFSALVGWLAGRTLPVLSEETAPEPAVWPRLSIVVAARDEADTMEGALRSLLASDYPDLQVVVVDDRSTDGTSDLVDRVAAEDDRLVAVHVTDLPDGWLGKVHALQRGLEASDGDWLLFTDADVHLAPGALRKAVAYAEDRGRDHVTALPRLLSAGLVLDACVGLFGRLVVGGVKPWEVADPTKERSAGVGAFNLSRRTVLERSEGFAWIKLEIADDMGLGLVMKRAGGRVEVLNGHDLVQLTFYPTVRSMVVGQEKAGFSILGRYSLARTLAISVMGPAIELSPLVGLIPGGPSWLPILAVSAYAFGLLQQALVNRFMGMSPWPALLHPVAIVLLGWMFARSGWICWRQGGVRWRDTFYATEDLRAGMRFKFI